MHSGNCREGRGVKRSSQVRSRRFFEKSVKEKHGRHLLLEAGRWVESRIFWIRAKFCTFSCR